MKFNRQNFIEETCGSLDAAMDCIDDLLTTLSGYIEDDECAEGHGSGCYGEAAKAQILSVLKDKQVMEFLDC